MSGEDMQTGQEAENSEHTPLLPPTHPQRWGSKISVASLIIPVAVAGRLAVLLPMTTTVDLVRQIVCRLWYAAQDPNRIPPIGRTPDSMCAVPPVERYFSAVMTVMTILETVGAMIGYSAVSYFASRYGRKPVMLSILGMYVAGLASLMAAQFAKGWAATVFLVLWITLHAVSGSPPLILVTNMYVIDVIDPKDRTAALSTIAGWTNLGGAPSFTIGGLIATRSQNVSLVFYAAAAIVVVTFVYIALVLPESFPKENRQELQLQRASEASATPRNATLRTALLIPFEPLKQLKPHRNPLTGRRNWRLTYCAIHVFVANIGDQYATMAIILFLTTKHGYTPANTGYVLTTYSVTSVLVLAFLIPLLVKFLRSFYTRSHTSDLGTGSGSRSTISEEGDVDVSTEVSGNMDVHITFISWTIVTLAMIFTGLAITKRAVLAAIVFWSLGAGRHPVFRSLVVASVDPLEQGEALSAIEMVAGVGSVLSPVVMGSILTATISTFPQLMFYVHGVVVMAAASVLFLVKDADRYKMAR